MRGTTGFSAVGRLGGGATLFEASVGSAAGVAGDSAVEVRIPVRIPVRVCRRLATPVLGVLPPAQVWSGGREPATPIRAEFRLVVADAGVCAGGLGALRGVIIGGGKAGFEKVSTDLDTRPFFSVRIRIIEDRLQPGVSSNAK